MLTLLDRAARRAAARSPWTPVYGLARTLLALGTLATLLVNPPDVLFVPTTPAVTTTQCTGLVRAGLFCLAGARHREAARWLAIALLAVAASGWRPRWTALPHWWVSFSLYTAATVVDGGDQVTAVLTLLLLPVALADGRRWHWAAPPLPRGEPVESVLRVVAHSALVVLRVQVAFVYLHSAVAKFGVTEWANGTALYYWLRNPTVGAPPWLAGMLLPPLTNGLVVSALTWGVLLLELLLGLSPLLPREARRPLLYGGLALHAGIAVVLGLPSFALAMFAALVLLLVDAGEPYPAARRKRAATGAATAPPEAPSWTYTQKASVPR